MKCISIFLTIVLFNFSGMAQEITKSKIEKSKIKIVQKKSYFRFGVNGILWQEKVDAERGGSRTKLDSEFRGFGLMASYRKPWANSKWEKAYSAEFSFGTLLSKGNPVIQDEFENQPWYSLMINPGVIYKNTRFSEVGLSFPVSFRSITWKLEDPTLRLDKNSSISYGPSFAYTSYLTPKNALTFSVTSQIAWSATQWTLGWNYKL